MRIADDRFGGRFATMAGTLRISSSQGNSCPKSLLGQVCSHIRSIGAGFKCSCVSRFADFCSGSNSTFVRVMHFLFQRREGGLTGPWGSSRVAFASLVSLELVRKAFSHSTAGILAGPRVDQFLRSGLSFGRSRVSTRWWWQTVRCSVLGTSPSSFRAM